MYHNEFYINDRKIGDGSKPFVVAEIGINHEGSFEKAKQMILDAYNAGCECVKFQCHIIEDEMIENSVIPGNAKESIWEIMKRCALSEEEERALKKYTEQLGMIYLSTPFSRAAADRLENMGVAAYKIGSGECNNYPLIKHIAKFKKPVILSTGMNDINSIKIAVKILEDYNINYALMHCTSMYPTPYEKVRLGAIDILRHEFPHTVIGLSDHSIGNYTCFGAVALGARILEKHFTSDKNWEGPDIPISIDPKELQELILGAKAIYEALGGSKNILQEEQVTIDFAYSTVVSIKDIEKGQVLDYTNIWVKRPGTGEIKARDFEKLLGKKVKHAIKNNSQLKWNDIDE